jgi:hypothetical protein
MALTADGARMLMSSGPMLQAVDLRARVEEGGVVLVTDDNLGAIDVGERVGAVASSDHVVFFDPTTRARTSAIKRKYCAGLLLSEDDRRLLCVRRDPLGAATSAVEILDVATGKAVWSAPEPSSVVSALAISGARLVVGFDAGLVVCVDLAASSVRRLSAHRERVGQVSIEPLLTTGAAKLCVWSDAPKPVASAKLAIADDRETRFAWSSDGARSSSRLVSPQSGIAAARSFAASSRRRPRRPSSVSDGPTTTPPSQCTKTGGSCDGTTPCRARWRATPRRALPSASCRPMDARCSSRAIEPARWRESISPARASPRS